MDDARTSLSTILTLVDRALVLADAEQDHLLGAQLAAVVTIVQARLDALDASS